MVGILLAMVKSRRQSSRLVEVKFEVVSGLGDGSRNRRARVAGVVIRLNKEEWSRPTMTSTNGGMGFANLSMKAFPFLHSENIVVETM